MILVYKLATTGLPLFREPDDDLRQPHIVALSAMLCRQDGEVEDELHRVVRPNGWEIPAETVQFHSVTPEAAAEHGQLENAVLAEFLKVARWADLRVAFNEPFDARIIRYALTRYPETAFAEHWQAMKSACAMRAGLDLLTKIDPATFRGRTIKLEALWHEFFGEELKTARDTCGRADAAREIYFEVLRRQRLGEAA